MDLRRQVLDASAALVASDGVDALSLREVARRAGVSHQAPYHHFGDREGILAALVEEGFARLGDGLAGAPGLAEAGEAYVRFALAHPGHFRVMFRPDLVALERHPGAAVQAKRALDALAALVDRLVAVGTIAPEERQDVLTAAWSLVHGLSVLLLDGPPGLSSSPETLARSVPAWFAALLRRP
jgi:AcrR family transcriptional regulator